LNDVVVKSLPSDVTKNPDFSKTNYVSHKHCFVGPLYGKNLLEFSDIVDKLPTQRDIQRKFYEDFGTWITNFEYYESLCSGLSCTFIAIWEAGHPAVHYWKNEMPYEDCLEALGPKRALRQ
jgi:hypothetical protein